MAEKNIFAHKLFLSLNIADFNLFYVKIATSPEKSHPLFPSNPPLSSPSFLKIWLEVEPLPPAEKGGGGVHTMLIWNINNHSILQ